MLGRRPRAFRPPLTRGLALIEFKNMGRTIIGLWGSPIKVYLHCGRTRRRKHYSTIRNVYIFPTDAEELDRAAPGGKNPYSPFPRLGSVMEYVRFAIFFPS